jgi:hypothetical protein
MSLKPAIDLTRNHFSYPSGDLVCVGTWLWNDDQEDYEPCIVIVPRYRKNGFKPCVVALSSAWRYNPEHGGPRYLARASKLFLTALGMDDCMSNAYKVAEIIQNNLGNLLKMPPNPTTTIVGADATVTINGRTHTIELLDHVPMAQA